MSKETLCAGNAGRNLERGPSARAGTVALLPGKELSGQLVDGSEKEENAVVGESANGG